MADLATIGKYRIDSVLGKGAMGVVDKAFGPGIDRGDHDSTLPGAGYRARARDHRSRHQAGESDPDRTGHAERRGFRQRPHRYLEPDIVGYGDGHAVVHVAGAMSGAGGRPPDRSL